jgi:hypothetical protein
MHIRLKEKKKEKTKKNYRSEKDTGEKPENLKQRTRGAEMWTMETCLAGQGAPLRWERNMQENALQGLL